MFIYGPPVRSDSPTFINRLKILNSILNSLERGIGLAILGPRRVGKTTILYSLKEKPPTPFFPIYIDLAILSPLENQSYSYLADKIFHSLPKEFQSGKPTKVVSSTDFYSFIQSISSSLSKRNKKLLLLMDEFDVLRNPFKDSFALVLRSLVSFSNNDRSINLILAGWTGMHSMMTDVGSPLANILQIKMIPYFQRDETRDLLIKGTSDLGISLSDENIVRIFHWTNGHPLFTQQFGSHVLRFYKLNPEMSLSISDIDEIANELVANYNFIFLFMRDRLINIEKKYGFNVLYKIYSGEEIKFNLSDQVIESLYFLDAIRERQGKCIISSNLFRLYLENYLFKEIDSSSSDFTKERDDVLSTIKSEGKISYSSLSIKTKTSGKKLDLIISDLLNNHQILESKDKRLKESFFSPLQQNKLGEFEI